MTFNSRPLADLAVDLDDVQAHAVRLTGVLSGLSLLFGALSALTVIGGVSTREPFLAVSASVAMVAAAAFGLCAQSLASAPMNTPRVRAALVTMPVRNLRRGA